MRHKDLRKRAKPNNILDILSLHQPMGHVCVCVVYDYWGRHNSLVAENTTCEIRLKALLWIMGKIEGTYLWLVLGGKRVLKKQKSIYIKI